MPNHADPRMAQGSLWYANHFFTRPLSVFSLLYHVSLRHPYPESRFALPSQFRSQTVSDLPLSSFAGPRTLCNACGLTYAKMVRDSNNRVRLQHRRPLHSRQSPTLQQSHLSFLPCHYRTKKPPEPRSLTQPAPPHSRFQHHTKLRAQKPALATAIVMRECNQAAPVCLTRAQIHAGVPSMLISTPVPTVRKNCSN